MADDPFGILLIDKPEEVTSHDVVAFVRRAGRFDKVGHAGTLDPLATGLLVLLIGRATRLAGRFLQDEKSYEATMCFGFSTDTGDREGKPVAYGSYDPLRLEKVQATFKALEGTMNQIPPMYSALKQGGKKLYELARKGISVDRPPRQITIRKLTLHTFAPPTLSFSLVCSKGTYVRALVETMGERLGCPGHLASLRRVRSGPFSIQEALPFETVRRLDRQALVKFIRLPGDSLENVPLSP